MCANQIKSPTLEYDELNSSIGVSIIVPIMNEIKSLPRIAEQIHLLKPQQVIYVDGGSDDGSWQWLLEHECRNSIQTKPGRALQMNAGAAKANQEILLFLHADTVLPKNALNEVLHPKWGRFDVEFYSETESLPVMMPVIAAMMNWRSTLTHVATGDQAIFVRKHLFEKVGGFDSIPIMEDVALSKKLRKICPPYCSKSKVKTSARRWQDAGVWRTILLMWLLRLAYFLGISPLRLALMYRQAR